MKFSIHQPISIQELGRRANQEDSMFPILNEANTTDRLFIVCDGMGGHENGEVASQLVCSELAKELLAHWNPERPLADDVLRHALDLAQDRLDEHDNGSLRKMGTTLTLVALHRAGVTMAHIGDSRIYHMRPGCGILYKSRDHSLVYDLFMAGEITQEQMATAPNKNIITRALMPCQERRPRLDITHTTNVQPGDWFMLCSDGVLEQFTDEALFKTVAETPAQQLRGRLIDLTAHNADNHTAHMLQVASVERESTDDQQPNDEATSRYNAIVLEQAAPSAPPVAQDKPQSAWKRFTRWLKN